jgi:hypothetical protein
MRSIDGKEAEYRLTGNIKDLKRSLKEADKAIAASEKKQTDLAKEYETASRGRKSAITKQINAEKALTASIKEQVEQSSKRQDAAEKHLDSLKRTNKEVALGTQRVKAQEAAESKRDKARETAAKKERARHVEHARALREDARLTEQSIENERRMLRLHSDAMAMDQRRTRDMLTNRAKEDQAIQKLQSRYAKLEQQLARLDRQSRKLATVASPTTRQNVNIAQSDAIAEMAVLKAELAVMGAVPIEQKIDLRVDEKGRGSLGKWLSAIQDTAIRIGPITTSIAGLGRGLLLLGPIVSGVAGQVGAFAGVLGSGLLGTLGAVTGGVGAFGLALGGVGLLMPKLLNDFSNLNSLQDAYHKQVLKTGANSEKAKTKLKEFQNALGEVPPSTLKTFRALEKLNKAWDDTAVKARPDFYEALGGFTDMAAHRMPQFQAITLKAFSEVTDGWNKWMKGLQSSEADRIFASLGDSGVKSIKPLMGALGNLGTVFGRIAESFGRWLPELMTGFERWTENMVTATGDANALDGVVRRMVGSMRDVGALAMAAGRFIAALFAPSVDPGRNMIQSWTDGLNRTAESMRTVKREKIGEFFTDAIDTANKFWRALKPVAELFFEWSTIMQPFTDVALSVAGSIGKVAEALLSLGPVKTALQTAFAIFLYGAVAKRVASTALGLASIWKWLMAIKATGGLAALVRGGAKGGLIRFATGGAFGAGSPGATPARPMFVKEVGFPGGKGGPGGVAGKAGKAGGAASTVGRVGSVARLGAGGTLTALTAGYAAFAILVNTTNKELTDTALKLDDLMDAPRGSARFKEMQKLTRQLEAANRAGDTKKMHEIANEIRRIGDASRTVDPERFRKLADNIDAAASKKSLPQLKIALKSVKTNFENLERGGTASMRQIKNVVEINTQVIKDRLGKRSAEGRQAMAKNMRMAAAAVRDRMRDMGKVTKEGTALVEKYMVAALMQMGLTKAQATAKHRRGTLQNSEDRPGNATIGSDARGGIHYRGGGHFQGGTFAGGGLTNVGPKGVAGPDNVPAVFNGQPALIAKGEQVAVFNRHQQKAMDNMLPGGLEGFFSANTRPHYMAAGGIVELGRNLQRQGYAVSEHPLFPPFNPGAHSPTGYHPKGMAIDVNADAMPGGEKANLDRLAAKLRGMPGVVELLWQVADHFNPLHVAMSGGSGAIGGLGIEPPNIGSFYTDMPGSPGSLVNTALKVAGTQAQKVVNQAAKSIAVEGSEGGISRPGAGAASKSQMEAWAREALTITGVGASPGNVAKILELAMKESSWIVDSINNWDINAKAGNPSGGLMHVTLDKVGGSMAALFDPIKNMVASIRYQIQRYGGLITHSPYAQGGIIDSMGPDKWAKGGKITKPTMLTGEDGGMHPEFVVGTNPAFKKSNVAALQAAAASLGVPAARESTKHRKPLVAKNSGRDVDRLAPVKRYAELQQAEDDKQRQISIAQSRVKEPDSLIKETGTDANGEKTYEVDQDAVNEYKGQMQTVRELYWDLVGKKGTGGIMGKLLNTGASAMSTLTAYRQDRENNIAQIKVAIDKDEKLLKSKDKDVRKKAQKRLEHNREILGEQQQKRQDAGQKRNEIGDDMHDARFRQEEYTISKEDLGDDIRRVAGDAAEAAASANPQPEPPTPYEAGSGQQGRLDALDAEAALAAIGQGMNGQPPREASAIMADQAREYQSQIDEARGMLNDRNEDGSMNTSNDSAAYALINSAASALQGIQAELAKYDPATNARLATTAANDALREFGNNFLTASKGAVATGGLAYGFGNPFSPAMGGGWRATQPYMGGAAQPGMGGRGQTVVNLKPTFANVPPDPHSWSKQVAFEIGAM